MKNGKRPTRRQQELIKSAGWNPDNWLVVKHLPTEMHLVHRDEGTTKVIWI
ncbi:DUF6906 family protein [Paenibacillus sp. SYP-B4298]|uniref:DUF6906 family protein n=1 Tax=Paenibacillus sp. SYP-B4298 TaxID=2996034 RepID=UPI003FA7E0B4